MEILAIAAILWVLGDAATRGRLTAAAKGTVKGTAKTGGRAAHAAASRQRDGHRAYLASGRAPLGRTRLAAGDGARALAKGGRDGARAELAKLKDEIKAAREEMERARRDAQDPAVGVQRGRLGHSFDAAPRDRRAPRVVATAADPLAPWRKYDPRTEDEAVDERSRRTAAELWDDPPVTRPKAPPVPAADPDGCTHTVTRDGQLAACGCTPVGPGGRCELHTPAPGPEGVRESDLVVGGCIERLGEVREPGFRRPVGIYCGRTPAGPGGRCDEHTPQTPAEAPAGTDPTITTEGNTIMSAMTAGSASPSVEIRSVPGFIQACESLAALGQSTHEGGVSLGIQPDAQAGLQDAVDILRNVAKSVRDTYQPLNEAADATPQGASGVTVGAARTE